MWLFDGHDLSSLHGCFISLCELIYFYTVGYLHVTTFLFYFSLLNATMLQFGHQRAIYIRRLAQLSEHPFHDFELTALRVKDLSPLFYTPILMNTDFLR